MNKYPNLDCQLYFLFRTHLWRDGELIEESFKGRFDSLHQNDVKIDEDKRLFRRNFDPKIQTEGLQNWQQYLADSWKDILQRYTDAYAEIPARNAEIKAKQFCEAAFYGVALLIMDENIVRHQVNISLRIEDEQHNLYFKQPKPVTKLLSVRDRDQQMSEMANLYAFALDSKPKLSHYALKFEGNLPYLALMQPQPTADNPILAVYALQHSSGLSKFNPNEILPWVKPFQDFLCVGSDEQAALFVSLLSRLIMRQWQFQRIDTATHFQRRILHEKNTLYRDKSEQYLVCTNNRKLEQELREIEQLHTDADYIKGRLRQAVRTLKINRTNLERLLQATQTRWQITWQFGSFKPLLDDFSEEMNKLHDHQEYLQGEVTYLTGARNRWHAYLEGRRLQVNERLNILGHVLVILIILAEIGNIFAREPREDSNVIMQWLHYLSSNAIVIQKNPLGQTARCLANL